QNKTSGNAQKKKGTEFMSISTGENPGAGTYKCTNCGTEITLGSGDKCPPCPKCNNTTFKKA
ncbi:MAG: hypothetical protein RSD19_05555, partial [Oscillospiraceae bacterium]